MIKFLNLLLAVLALAGTAFLYMQMQSMQSGNALLAETVTQVKADTESKLKDVSTTIDGLTSKITALEGQSHTAASAPEPASAPATTPPVVVSPPAAAPAPEKPAASATPPAATPPAVPMQVPAAGN